MPDEKRTAPGGESEGLDVRLAGDTLIVSQEADADTQARCLKCGAVITCEKSIRIGIGTDCRRLIRRLALAMTT